MARLDEHLHEDARTRICGIVERAGTLVIFASSAAWSARVRFAIAEIEEEIRRAHPAIIFGRRLWPYPAVTQLLVDKCRARVAGNIGAGRNGLGPWMI